MSESRPTTFGDLGTLFDGPHATPTRTGEGPYFLNIASLKAGRLDLAASDHVSPEDFERWTRRVTPRSGDLLFSYETRLGEAALMPEGVEACLGRRMALLRPDRTIVHPRFLLYYYLSAPFQRLIEQNTVQGATVTRIGLATMPSWSVMIPSLSDQHAIAEVLGALDDKIVAGEEVIRRAESLTVALSGRAAVVAEVRDVAARVQRAMPPTTFEPMVTLFSLPAFDAGVQPEVAFQGDIKSSKFLIETPAVLVSKLNPRIPRTWNVVEVPDPYGVASTEFVVLVPVGVSSTELWGALAQPSVSSELMGKVSGTSGSHQRVKPEEVLGLVIPDPRALSGRARSLIDCLGEIISSTRREKSQLSAKRDELLPLLISGRLRVRDAEKVVGEVV